MAERITGFAGTAVTTISIILLEAVVLLCGKNQSLVIALAMKMVNMPESKRSETFTRTLINEN